MTRAFLLSFGLIAVIGCVRTNAAMLDESLQMEPICSNAVRIYTDTNDVPKPYTEIALLNSEGDANETTESAMVNSQRKKAAKLGANGLIIGQILEPKAGTKIIGALLGTGASRKGSAMAIHVPSDTSVKILCDGTDNLTRTRK